MKNFLNATLIYLGLRSLTVSTAVADLEKALARLEQAEKNHSAKGEALIYQAEQAMAAARKHDEAAVRATRISTELKDLIA